MSKGENYSKGKVRNVNLTKLSRKTSFSQFKPLLSSNKPLMAQFKPLYMVGR